MQLQRLTRLMSIISDIRHNPRSHPDELCARFAISRRQFYKDRDTLESLGYVFHHSRSQNRLILDAQPQPAWDGLFDLSLALQALIAKDELNAMLSGLDAIRELVAQLPQRPQKLLSQALEQLVWEHGLQCGPAVLDELLRCIGEGRRVVILLKNDDERHFLLDPQELLLYRGTLYLVSSMLPPGHELAAMLPVAGKHNTSHLKLGLAVRHIRKVVPTPFYAV